MRAFLAVLAKESFEHRWVLPAALLLGTVPPILQWTVRWPGVTSSEVRDTTALPIAWVFLAGTAIVFGASLVSRELASRRLGFYFVRPLGMSSLWWGKLTGALAVLVVSFGAVWLPSVVAGSRPWKSELPGVQLPRIPVRFASPYELWDFEGVALVDAGALSRSMAHTLSNSERWWILAAAFLLLVLLACFVATSVRVRAIWTVLDLVLAPLAVLLAVFVLEGLLEHGARAGFRWALTVTIGLVFLAALLAPWIQLWQGRSSLSRSRAVHSITFWGIVLAGCGLLLVSSQAAVRTAPAELDRITAFKTAPQGDWAVVGGIDRGWGGLYPAFALNTSDGRYETMGSLVYFDGPPVFSSEGQTLVWNRCLTEGPCELHVLDLSEPSPASRPTEISLPRPLHGGDPSRSHWDNLGRVALSPGGERVAVARYPDLAVYEIASARQVVSLRLPPQDDPAMTGMKLLFDADDLVRVYLRAWGVDGPSLEVWELGVSGRQWARVGEIDAGWSFYAAPRNDRLAVWGQAADRIAIYDGRGTRRLSDLVLPFDLPWEKVRLRFLAGGTIAVTSASSHRLVVYSSGGLPRQVLHLPGPVLSLGGEPVAGSLLIALLSEGASDHGRRFWRNARLLHDVTEIETFLVDLYSGEFLLRWPATLPSWNGSDAGSPATRLVATGKGGLGRIDPGSGELEVLFAGETSGEAS